jgi:hypothetical protein
MRDSDGRFPDDVPVADAVEQRETLLIDPELEEPQQRE